MLADHRCYATLPVSDLAPARRFYEGTLGFTPVEIKPAAVMYGAGEGAVFVASMSSGAATGTHTQLGFEVSDIDAEVADLRKRGVVFEAYDHPTLKTVDGIAETPAGRAAWFKDPAGNLIGLIQFA